MDAFYIAFISFVVFDLCGGLHAPTLAMEELIFQKLIKLEFLEIAC